MNIRVMLFIACLILMKSAKADYWWNYVDVKCDPIKQKVIINLGVLEDEDPSMEWHGTIRSDAQHPIKTEFRVSTLINYGECALSSGTTVRIKLSEGRTMPYGMCGADPEMWISLWVGQRRWLSKRQIAGRCTTNPMSSIVVTPQKLVWCVNAEENGIGAGANKKVICESIPSSKLPKESDYVEYPPANQSHPEPGSIVIERGGEIELCKSMIEERKTKFGLNSWILDIPTDTDYVQEENKGGYEFEGHFTKNLLDIDNDGTVETVYGFHPRNHAHDADIYFASSGKDMDGLWPKVSEEQLWKSAPYVFPNQYGQCEGGKCTSETDGLFPLYSFSEDGNVFTYRLRYLHVKPFIWDNVTYFFMIPIDIASENIYSVIKPVKNHAPEEVCIFRRVMDNY